MDDLEQQLQTLREQAESDRALLHQLNDAMVGGENSTRATEVDLTPLGNRIAHMESQHAQHVEQVSNTTQHLAKRIGDAQKIATEHEHPLRVGQHDHVHEHDRYAEAEHTHKVVAIQHDHGPHEHSDYSGRSHTHDTTHRHTEVAPHDHPEFGDLDQKVASLGDRNVERMEEIAVQAALVQKLTVGRASIEAGEARVHARLDQLTRTVAAREDELFEVRNAVDDLRTRPSGGGAAVDLTPIETRVRNLEARIQEHKHPLEVGQHEHEHQHGDYALSEHGHEALVGQHEHPHDHAGYARESHGHDRLARLTDDHELALTAIQGKLDAGTQQSKEATRAWHESSRLIEKRIDTHAHSEVAEHEHPPHTHAEYAEHGHPEFAVIQTSVENVRKAWAQAAAVAAGDNDDRAIEHEKLRERFDNLMDKLADREIIEDENERTMKALAGQSTAHENDLLAIHNVVVSHTDSIQSQTVDLLALTNRLGAQERLIVDLQSKLNGFQPASGTADAKHTHPEFEALAAENRRHSHPNLDAWLTQNWQSIQDRLNALEGNPAPVS